MFHDDKVRKNPRFPRIQNDINFVVSIRLQNLKTVEIKN